MVAVLLGVCARAQASEAISAADLPVAPRAHVSHHQGSAEAAQSKAVTPEKTVTPADVPPPVPASSTPSSSIPSSSIPAPVRATPDDQGFSGRTLQLEVFINGVSTKMIGSFMTLDNDRLMITRKELKGVGLRPDKNGADEEWIVLNSLDGMAYRYDEPRQRLDIEASDARRLPHELDGRGPVDPLDAPTSGYGAALNYLLFATSTQEQSGGAFQFAGASMQLDGRIFTPFGYMQQGYIIGKTLNAQMEALRLDTTFVHHDVASARTYRLGDFISGGMSWSRPVRLGGFQIERNFGIRSDLVTAAMPSISGSAAVPSSIEVYVNNVRTMAREVPAGPYQVSNIPGMTGAGEARIVVRDASGREVTSQVPFYASSRLLAPGTLDYSAQIGVPRFNYAAQSFSYAPWPMMIGSLRYGMTDQMTLESYGEWGGGTANGGVGLITTYGNLGTFSLAGRLSQYGAQTGGMIYSAFETQLWGMSFQASTQRTFGTFEDLASVTARTSSSTFSWNSVSLDVLRLDPFANVDSASLLSATTSTRVPRAMDRVSVGIPLLKGRSGLGLSFLNVERDRGDVSHIFTANYSQLVGERAVLSVNAFTDVGSKRSLGIYANVSFPIGAGAQASVGTSTTNSGTSVNVDVSKPLSQKVGDYGWRARRSDGGDSSGMGGAASYRSHVGRVEVSGETYTGGSRVSGEVEGSLTLTRSGIQMGNRIDESFAVVNVGSPDVPVYHENRLVGVTGMNGKLLVPDLVPYQKNKISIDTTKLPVSARVGQTQTSIVPAEQAGVDIDFGVHAGARSVVAVLTDAAGKPLAAGLKGRVLDTDRRVAIGYDGQVFLDDVKDSNTILVDLLDKECRVSFSYQGAGEGQDVIGPFICQ